jgi:hypothetical protein
MELDHFVFQNILTLEWYYIDEVGAFGDEFFTSKAAAKIALLDYCFWLDTGLDHLLMA